MEEKRMTTANTTLAKMTNFPVSLLRSWFSRLWALNKPVTLSIMLYIVLVPIYTIAAIADPRLITNAPAFIKPLKFILSTGIYVATFLYLLTLVKGRRLWVQIAANLTALGLLVENIIITAQAIRGIPSHFNATTPLDSTLYNIMGGIIIIIAVLNLLLAIWLIFQRMADPVIAWGLRLGVLISFVGMIVAYLMTSGPTPSQMAQLEAGQKPAAIGAHSVGVEDGGPGLPILGWSTEGGDLRIAHFVGLHGMQALPLLALLLNRRRSLNRRQRLLMLVTGGVAYTAWLGLLAWQALRGQSIIAPDLLTWAAYAGLIAFVLAGVMIALTLLRDPASIAAQQQAA
jgi:hypothetical protein